MAEKKYYWLKLKDNFFSDLNIKKLRKLAGGDTYVIIYLKMQLIAMQSDGIITYKGIENSFAEELALDIDEDADNVAVTLQYLSSVGLCETSDGIEFFLPYAVENVGSETSTAKRVRECRAKKEALQCNKDVTACNTEIEIEKDIEIEKEESAASRLTVPVQEIFDVYNEICVSLPHAETITQMRRKAIHARYIEVKDVEKFKAVFRKAQESAFLTGRNDRGWRADLDWILKPANFTKIAEGNYDNRSPKAAVSSESFDADEFVAKALERGVR